MANQPPRGQPGRIMPGMARAFDLPSLLAAVNAARQILTLLAGPGTPANNLYQLSAATPSVSAKARDISACAGGCVPDPNAHRPLVAPPLPNARVQVKSTWRAENRVTNPLRVYHHDPVDRTQYVDVVRIYQEVFSPDGSATEQPMIWRYGKSP